jgi:glycosyltransferase involved in cell wall biosynthesis
LFNKLGLFDELYVPAYYEDTDLAFKVRKEGLKVLYQPLSVVIHHEGISSGTELGSGIKSYQDINAEKFYNRWRDELLNHSANGYKPEKEKERNIQKRILVLDACTPTPDKDSGSLDVISYFEILSSLGHKITFAPVDNYAYFDKYTRSLQRMGVECLYAPYVDNIEKYLKTSGSEFDVVMLYRANYAYQNIDSVRKYCSNAKIIFNTVDVHYLRESRQAELENDDKLRIQAERTRQIEEYVIQRSDTTVVISNYEYELLKKEFPASDIVVIPLLRAIPGRSNGFKDRKDVVFIGGFSHQPNIDAVKYLVREIWPFIRSCNSKIHLLVLGSNVPEEITGLATDDVQVIGYVHELADYFDSCRLTVAPLRYGAGQKGKVATSLGFGVPCIATSVAVEGSGLENNKHIVVEDDPEKFAARLVELYNNEDEWYMFSDNGLDFVEQNYSHSANKELFTRIF